MNTDNEKNISALLDRLLDQGSSGPVGESLYDSGEVDALVRRSLDTPETEVAGHIIPGRTADWPEIEKDALKLLAKSLDISLVVLLAEASLRTNRLLAFTDALRSIAYLVRDHWDRWFPYEDENGELDIAQRENALAELHTPRVLTALRAMRPFSAAPLRALRIADLLPNADDARPDNQVLQQALSKPGVRGEVERTRQALASCVEALHEITEALNAKSAPVDFSRLSKVLGEVASTLDGAIRKSQDELLEEDIAPPRLEKSTVATTFTRESAKKVLLELIGYYNLVEPSSPVPLYLKRAHSLVGLSFEEAVKAMGDDVGKFINN